MAQGSYKQFCPVAMTAEVLCTRWTVVLLRELLAGSTRFNDLRRGVPRMSPALLSRRLKELEAAEIVERKRSGAGGLYEYHLTCSGRELEPVVTAFGVWGQRWVESEITLEKSGCAASHVGHAAQSRRDADAQAAVCDRTSVSGGSSSRRRSHRAVLDRSWVRRRSLHRERPEDDDGDLDGPQLRACGRT